MLLTRMLDTSAPSFRPTGASLAAPCSCISISCRLHLYCHAMSISVSPEVTSCESTAVIGSLHLLRSAQECIWRHLKEIVTQVSQLHRCLPSLLYRCSGSVHGRSALIHFYCFLYHLCIGCHALSCHCHVKACQAISWQLCCQLTWLEVQPIFLSRVII